MAARLLVVACALFLGMCIITSGKPAVSSLAFCKVIWLVGLPCDEVQVAIVTQIKAMGSYKLGPVTSSLIQANHTSAVGQTEAVNFTMTSTSMAEGCHMGGTSTSAFWLSEFDNSTNYCNLQNVIQGSGLTEAPGFVEYTNEWLCLGFEYSACKRF